MPRSVKFDKYGGIDVLRVVEVGIAAAEVAASLFL
jgi:hypothetical protein